MKLLINTGGKGERLYPLTRELPKPMVKICEKPVLHHLIDWAKNNGIKEVVMLNGYKKEKIIEYFEDGRHFGVSIIHSNENYPLGSGGAIRYAKRHIDGRFAYISGDLVSEVDLKKMLRFHEYKKAEITALVHPSKHPEDSDILKLDENHKVIRFVSKKENHFGVGNLTNAGLCVIEPEIIDMMEQEVFNFETYLFPKIIGKKIEFFGYPTNEFIHDMGTFERLKICEDFLKARLSTSNISRGHF